VDFIKEIVRSHYGIEVIKANKLTVGAGSNTYFLVTDSGKYILKNANINEANNPKNEPPLCEYLLARGLPVSEFIKNTDSNYLFTHDSNMYHMQRFIEGVNYEWNEAPKWLLRESARVLGKIHMVLSDYTPLPVGIGENFFKYMTPMNALASYEKSYQYARQINDDQSAEDISFRIELMKRFSVPDIQLYKLTRKNTHGDFFISQLICGDDKINAVIDWTTACIHPVVWEVIRSYVYAAPECRNGDIDTAKFLCYVKDYLSFSTLTESDIKMMPYVFYYQISVCDYYNQYFQSNADNREIYLQQASLSTKLMKWFDKNADDFSDFLIKSINIEA
jgi:Ser/Thr protein kinase RdoA (MazF antagonist)